MKYDKDIIETIYLLQQSDPQLAERMWDRLISVTQEQVNQKFTNKINNGNNVVVTYDIHVPKSIVTLVQKYYSENDKQSAITVLGDWMGWGRKKSTETVELMIAQGMIV